MGDLIERIDELTQRAWDLRNNDEPQANALATEARELAIEHGYALGQARAARTLAMTVTDSGDIHLVFSLADEATRKFDEAGDGEGRAAARDFMASLCEYLGDLSGGLEWALDALSIAREIGQPERQGYALSSVGGILAASGEVDAGVERLKEALELFEGLEDAHGEGTICSRLCRIFSAAGRDDEALKYAERCRAIAKKGSYPFLDAEAFTVMARVAHRRGDSAEAVRLYRDAIGGLRAGPERDLMGARISVDLANVLIEQRSVEEAETELADVLGRIGGDDVSMVTESEAHEALARINERQGKLAETIEHLRKAQALRERVWRQEAHNKLAQAEGRAVMEAAKKDAEIHRLRFVELHSMQSKLLEVEKMALAGKLAAGTAHELHTPLGVLRSNAKLSVTAAERLVSLMGDDIDKRANNLVGVLESCSEASDQAIERIASIARSFGLFAQLDQADYRAFDVRAGVESALMLLTPTFPDDITVERNFEEVPAVDGWPRELNHAFMTVLQNAAEAIDGPGVIAVSTASTDKHVVVRVRDTGRGMSEDQAAHLFDVAWSEDGTRTKMRLGLCAAHATVSKHDGTIEVATVLGEGTTVTFRLPSSVT